MGSDRTYSLFVFLNSTTVSRLVIIGLNSAKYFLRKIRTNYLAEGIVPICTKHIFLIVMAHSKFTFRTTIYVQNNSTFNYLLFDV